MSYEICLDEFMATSCGILLPELYVDEAVHRVLGKVIFRSLAC